MALILDPGYLDDPTHCPHPGLWGGSPGDEILAAGPRSDEPMYLPPGFLVAVAGLVVVCVTLTILVAMALILLVQHHPMATVVATLTAQVLVPATMGVIAMQRGGCGRWVWTVGVDGCPEIAVNSEQSSGPQSPSSSPPHLSMHPHPGSPLNRPPPCSIEKETMAYVCFAGAAILALCYLLFFESVREKLF